MASANRLLRRAAKVAVYGALCLVLAGLSVAVVAHFSDGPLGPFPGGRMRGELVREPVSSWEFAAGRNTLELQVGSDRPRSVTTWLMVDGGDLYVPSAFAAAKTWPGIVAREGHVVVRIDGRLYPCRAERVEEPELRERLLHRLAEKYELGDGNSDMADGTWIFRVASEPGASPAD